MNRREFLRDAAVIAAGAIAADQFELLERLAYKRRLFSGWTPVPILYGDGIHDDAAALQAYIDGEPFRWASKPSGEFLLTSTLYVRHDSPRIPPTGNYAWVVVA